MASRHLHTLTQEECKKYFDVLQKNADKQWNIANTLYKTEQYGAATSHLLISIEESIKSIILFMDSQGYNFRNIKGIDSIFNNHRIRFFIAYFMFAVTIFGDDFIQWLQKVKENPEFIKKQTGLFLSKNDLPISFKYYLLRKFVLLEKEKYFFKRADLVRQIGFYADYDDEVQSPQSMTLQTYEEIYDKLNKVKRFVKGLIDAYTPHDEQTATFIEEHKLLFNNRKYRRLLEIGLLKIKKTKSSPFEILKKYE